MPANDPQPSARRIAAHTRWAMTENRTAATTPARNAFLARFERQVDPDNQLTPVERARRAQSARKAYFARLALLSARSRASRRPARPAGRRATAEARGAGDEAHPLGRRPVGTVAVPRRVPRGRAVSAAELREQRKAWVRRMLARVDVASLPRYGTPSGWHCRTVTRARSTRWSSPPRPGRVDGETYPQRLTDELVMWRERWEQREAEWMAEVTWPKIAEQVRRMANRPTSPSCSGSATGVCRDRGHEWGDPLGLLRRTRATPSPLFVDVAALLADGLPEPPEPAVLARRDGRRLFYAGQVNSLIGDPECGKSWIAYAAVVETLQAGRRALIIDLDHNGASQILARLLALGVPPAVLGDPDRFRLAEPEDGASTAPCSPWPATGGRASPSSTPSASWSPCSRSPATHPTTGRRLNRTHARATGNGRRRRHRHRPPAQVGRSAPTRRHRHRGKEAQRRRRVAARHPARAVRTGPRRRVSTVDQQGPARRRPCVLPRRRQGAARGHLRPRADARRHRVLARHGTQRTETSSTKSADDDIAELDALDPPPKSVREVRERLHWRTTRAGLAFKAWKETSRPMSRPTRCFPFPTYGVGKRGNTCGPVSRKRFPRFPDDPGGPCS